MSYLKTLFFLYGGQPTSKSIVFENIAGGEVINKSQTKVCVHRNSNEKFDCKYCWIFDLKSNEKKTFFSVQKKTKNQALN